MKNQVTLVNPKSLGLTETLNFNGNYGAKITTPIEMIEVRQNPKNKRVFFGKIKDKAVLNSLQDSFGELICKSRAKHNEFAFYNYQIVES